MKKVFLFLLTVSVFFCISCKKNVELKPLNFEPITVQEENLTFRAEPKSDLLMIALRLSGHRTFSFNSNQNYVSTVDNLVEKYKDHDFVKFIKKHTKNYYGPTTSIFEISKYISDDLTTLNLDKNNLPAEVLPYWSKINFEKFMALYNDFANTIQFARIWKLCKVYSKICVVYMQDLFKKNPQMTSWVNDYFFDKSAQINYVVNVSPFAYYFSKVLTLQKNGNKTTIEMFLPTAFSKDGNDDVFIVQVLIRGINETLMMENWPLVEKTFKPIMEEVFKKNKISTLKMDNFGYVENLAEVVSIACSPYYMAGLKSEEIAEELMDYYLRYTIFDKMDDVIEVFGKYQNDRETYPNYEAFLKNYLLTDFADQLKGEAL